MLKNGELLALAAQEFQAFVTVDQNLSFQQNLACSISVIVFADDIEPSRWSQAADASAFSGDSIGKTPSGSNC